MASVYELGIQLSVSMRKAYGRLRYSSESWSRDVGLGSRRVLCMASGVSSPGPGLVVSERSFDLRLWVSLCSSVISNSLGTIICWGTLASVWGLGSVLVLSCLGSACCDIVLVIRNGSSFVVSVYVGWVVKWVIPSSNITSRERKVELVSLSSSLYPSRLKYPRSTVFTDRGYNFDRFKSTGM